MKEYKDIIDFHGHSCPGLALGYRAARAALKNMGMKDASEDEELVAIVENDSCAVDAIQAVTGCTFGKGNLIFKDYGKQVYTFIKRPSGDAVRIAVDFTPPEETEEEKSMWQRYSDGERSEEILKVVYNRKARKIKAILEAKDSELLKITKMNLPPPDEARIKQGRIVCIPCFEKK